MLIQNLTVVFRECCRWVGRFFVSHSALRCYALFFFQPLNGRFLFFVNACCFDLTSSLFNYQWHQLLFIRNGNFGPKINHVISYVSLHSVTCKWRSGNRGNTFLQLVSQHCVCMTMFVTNRVAPCWVLLAQIWVIMKKSSPKNLLADCRPPVGRLLAVCRPTGFLQNTDYQSADSRPTVGDVSVRCR